MSDMEITMEPTTEEQRIWEWKVNQFEGLGFPLSDAVYLAASPDNDVVHVAHKLMAGGCSIELALKILA